MPRVEEKRMDENELPISFDRQYEGHIKDDLRTRFSSFSLFIVVGLFGIFGGVYCVLGGFQGPASDYEFTSGIVFMIIGVLLIASSPFSFFFGGTMNRKCQGKIAIRFFKPNLELKLWRYELSTSFKKRPFFEKGDLNEVEDKKKYAIVGLENGKTLHVLYSEISQEQKEALLRIGKETKEYLANEARKRKEYHSGSNLD